MYTLFSELIAPIIVIIVGHLFAYWLYKQGKNNN